MRQPFRGLLIDLHDAKPMVLPTVAGARGKMTVESCNVSVRSSLPQAYLPFHPQCAIAYYTILTEHDPLL